jgi:hypothetical protein
MEIIYQLSKRQKKKILEFGKEIILALPAPSLEVKDPVEWAKSVLPADCREYVVSATLEEIRMMPGAGTDGLLPTIRPDTAGGPMWTIPVVVILAHLARGTPRNKSDTPQWPADVLINGRSFLEEIKAAEQIRPDKQADPSVADAPNSPEKDGPESTGRT